MPELKISDKVTVRTGSDYDPDEDRPGAAAKRESDATKAAAGAQRAAQVEALKTEKAYLERQPKPNEARLAQVDEQISAYAEKPARARKQTAAKA